MDNLINALKGHSGAQDRQTAQVRVGTVQSYDPVRYLARVALQPEGNLSGWLPVAAMGIGPGWGMMIPLSVNDQVLCIPQEGDADSMHIIGRIFAHQGGVLPPSVPSAFGPTPGDQSGNAPSNPQTGEMLLVSKAGAVIRLGTDGSIYIKGNLYLDGDFFGNGDVYDYHGPLDRLRRAHNGHLHGGVQSGGSDTAIPTILDPE